MDIEYKINGIGHCELSDLFSTAMYGSEWFGIDIPDGESEKVEASDTSYEDHLASIILNGGTLDFYDQYAEESDENPVHHVNYNDIIEGLNKCFKICPYNINNIIKEYYDYFDANNCMQVIMFGKVVYG